MACSSGCTNPPSTSAPKRSTGSRHSCCGRADTSADGPAGRRRIGGGADLSLPALPSQVALQECRDAIDETEQWVARPTQQLREFVSQWRWAPLVNALQALRGVSFVTAAGLVAEIGDLRRFERAWFNFQTVYRPLADAWAVYESSGLRPRLVEKGP